MPDLQGQLVIESVHSALLQGNLPGDPTRRDIPVYLPPSYGRDPQRRYPTVYCLAGYSGTGQSFLNYNCWSPTIVERIEKLILTQGMPEVIAVIPDAMTRWGGSQYINSSANGPYQDYIADELVAYVDAHFRTLPRRASRACMGKSSGGYGALMLGMQRSDVFGAVACHAGDMCFEYCYMPDVPKAASAIAERGGLQMWVSHFEQAPKKKGSDFVTMSVVGMAASYSPAPDSPFGFDLPFDERTSAFRQDVWERWLRHDPLRILPQHAEALASLSCLFIDCGTQDEYNLHLGSRMLAAALQERKIAHRYEEFPDGHRDTGYRFEVSLPLLAAALRQE